MDSEAPISLKLNSFLGKECFIGIFWREQERAKLPKLSEVPGTFKLKTDQKFYRNQIKLAFKLC